MKKIKYSIALIVSLWFSGCGGGGTGAASADGCGSGCLDEATYEVVLYEDDGGKVYPGDALLPLQEPTVIEVTHTYGNDIKDVKIIVGSARLVRGNYAITN